jgi:hypothetical protein
MMKILRAFSVLSGTAILLLGASAGQASAGEFYGWGSCAGCGAGGGYGYGYGAYASGGWVSDAAVGSTYFSSTEYPRYIVGHGPMYPGDSYSGPRYSYMTPPTPAASPAPAPAALIAPAPAVSPAPALAPVPAAPPVPVAPVAPSRP